MKNKIKFGHGKTKSFSEKVQKVLFLRETKRKRQVFYWETDVFGVKGMSKCKDGNI